MVTILFVMNEKFFEDISTANNTNMPADIVESDAAYGEVDKTKKIQKKKTSSKEKYFVALRLY